MKYTLSPSSDAGICSFDGKKVTLNADRDADEAFFSLRFDFPEWEDDAYLMMPACAYNGNRFKRVVRGYPPMYRPEECGENAQPLMTDVPALEPDGSGRIEVTSGDMATPCVGIYYRKKKEGFLLFTEQAVKGKNIGFTAAAGCVTLSFPAHRSDLYRFCTAHAKSGDTGIPVKAGEAVSSEIRILTFSCDTIPEFFRVFFENRKLLLRNERTKGGYTDELFALMETHFNTENWSGKYYAETNKMWQTGWVGGGMSSYVLLRDGNALSKKRAAATVDFMVSHQAPSGFYYGIADTEGRNFDDSFGTPGMEGVNMTRKSADALYYLYKHLTIPGRTPNPAWEESAVRCADAFVRLFDTYGTFGQFVDVETGKMLFGASASAAIAPAALASAYRYTGDKRYLDTAEKGLRFYCETYLANGVTNGGPGEILSAPDSESAFGLLESCVVLYETTKKPEYLAWAEDTACLCSSWTVSYSYHFPENSEFGRLGINTVGAVFANVQNKHAAPGICTLSGDSLYKLWKYTQKDGYFELLADIASAIPQSVSTDSVPIYSWDETPQRLIPGCICERVNMSDWEGFANVGGVFNGSCWCETSLILSYTELLCYPELREILVPQAE